MAGGVGMLGSVLSLAGTLVSSSAQMQMVQEQTAASKRAENTREQQMQMESQRRRRQAIREGVMARSMSLSAGAAQGAQYGTSVASGMAGATSMAAENQQGINSAEILGGRIFQANRDYFDATQRGQMGMAIGGGISAIGGALASNAGAIERIGGGSGTTGSGGTTMNTMTAPQPAPRPTWPGFGYRGHNPRGR